MCEHDMFEEKNPPLKFCYNCSCRLAIESILQILTGPFKAVYETKESCLQFDSPYHEFLQRPRDWASWDWIRIKIIIIKYKILYIINPSPFASNIYV